MKSTANCVFHDLAKKNPVMNEERRCVQRLAEFAVSYQSYSNLFQTG